MNVKILEELEIKQIEQPKIQDFKIIKICMDEYIHQKANETIKLVQDGYPVIIDNHTIDIDEPMIADFIELITKADYGKKNEHVLITIDEVGDEGFLIMTKKYYRDRLIAETGSPQPTIPECYIEEF
jgi:hypothetical protein